jgi:hypothetical protein
MDLLKEELRPFLTDPNHYVAQTAHLVISSAAAVERGEMTIDEFQELVEDTIETKRMSVAAQDVKTAAMVAAALDKIISLLPRAVGLLRGA